MSMVEKPVKCKVREGMFVEPCWALSDMVENNTPSFSKQKGVAEWKLTNIKTREPSRRYYGILSKAHPKGMLFNYCPWCGEQIDAPFAGED